MWLNKIGVGTTTLLIVGGVLWFHYVHRETAISAIVIPHHDMVADARADFLQQIKDEVAPETLIIVSPDHFEEAKDSIVVTGRVWETSVGRILPDLALMEQSGLSVHDAPFIYEHGVTSIIGPLHKTFPDAQVLPVMVSRRATYSEMQELTQRLASACNTKCLLVASIDFSHTTHRGVAKLHDELSLRALRTQDSILAYKYAEVDSPESLAMLIEWSRIHGTDQFDLFAHTNSGVMRDEEVGEMTTHIMGAYGSGKKTKQESYTFMIGGDTMFARGVHEAGGNPLERLGERFFWGVDDAVLNLEGVFEPNGKGGVSIEGWSKLPPVLGFDPVYVQALKHARVSVLSTMNNHSDDLGWDGYAYTHTVLRDRDLEVIGNFATTSGIGVYIREGADIPVAYVSFDVVAHAPLFIDTVKELSMKYKVVVLPHWGKEYETVHNEMQQKIAYDLIDAGADLVVGSHSHVIQDVEVYKGVPIFYSVGNFLFDQNFSDTVQQGLVVGGVFTYESLDVFLVPVHTYLKPFPIQTEDAGEVFRHITDTLAPYRVDIDRYRFPF